MASNDIIILDQILAAKRNEIASQLDEHEYFEIFSSEQILKNYELSYEELDSGNTGKGNDGGCDAFYVFVNDELVQEDSDFTGYKRGLEIRLYIVQSKTSKGFTETAIDKFIDITDNLLDLSKSIEEFENVYNKKLLENVRLFRTVYEQLAPKFPKFFIDYCYVTKGNTRTISHGLKQRVERLRGKVKQLFSDAEYKFNFLGASDLLILARRQPQTSYALQLVETPISSSRDSFVGLVNLSDFHKFIIDENGNLRKSLFEANVRDYQGKTSVNEEIQNGLRKLLQEDFWWLNNGVTILASNATHSSKVLHLESPEIVNGLQTSAEIHKYFSEVNPQNETRTLLVRVIPAEAESRDRIIKATNSQTPISTASLRATERIHRDIEDYLRSLSLYYDRRKNYYKNEGKPISRIVSIPYVAQSVMAIVLQRPDDARGRPSSLIKDEEDYDLIFTSNYPIEIYYSCIQIMHRIESFLKNTTKIKDLDRKTHGDIKFFIGVYLPRLFLKKIDPTVSEISKILIKDLDDALLEKSTERVLGIYKKMVSADPFTANKVAKSPEFRDEVLKDIKSVIQS